MNNYEMMQNLRENDYVREKNLGNCVSSFNFTKKAFFKQVWNEQTIKARGLFLDSNSGNVVARSYEKFFDFKFDDLAKFEYPVKAYVKYNGFLGILSVHENEFMFCSKSTNEGPYTEMFKDIFNNYVREDDKKQLFDMLKKHNCSAVFEVVSSKRDPHIIDYGDKEFVVLLDVIKNQFEFETILDDKDFDFMKRYKKRLYGVYDSRDALDYDYIDLVFNDEYEGFVLIDANGYMVKLKTDNYKFWKKVRGLVHKIAAGKDVEDYRREWNISHQLVDFVRDYLDKCDYIPSIIELRREFW